MAEPDREEKEHTKVLSNLREQIASFPNDSGVYLFKSIQDKVLYVGKAKDLKKRVLSYLRDDLPIKTKMLMARAQRVDFMVTATEKDALLLENNLIKQHRPRYNVDLRDDKSYPCLRLTVNDDYPRLEIMRRPVKDGAMYFGPFSSAKAVRQTLKLMQRLFPLRRCRGKVGASKRPCLNFQMGRCLGPCWGGVSKGEYNRVVREAIYFLQGKRKELERTLKKEMEESAENLNFERAAKFRDRLASVRATLEKQHIVHHSLTDADILGVFRGEHAIDIAVLNLRGGSLVGSRSFVIDVEQIHSGDLLSDFLKRYYYQNQLIPSEILLPEFVTDQKILEEWISEERGKKVRILMPQRGGKRDLVQLANQNASTFQKTRLSKEAQTLEVLNTIMHSLKLSRLPRSIECYDISTTMGKQSVGSRVSFFLGEPNKMGYRRYKVASKGHPDDYSMMREVLSRRINRADEDPLPDLIVVDGGKGQLNVALKVAEQTGVHLDIVGIAKDETDKVYLPGRKNPVLFRADSKALHLLQRIRDESHRFAIEYHRKLRSKKGLDTILTSIPGVGPNRKNILLKHFGSLELLRRSREEEIAAAPGISTSLAKTIYTYLHGREHGR